MCLFDRNTARRGRAAVPRTSLRTRRCRRFRLSVSCFTVISSRLLCGLPGLAQHALAGVADALALVRLGLADLADVGGHLADELLVDARHHDAVRRGHLEGDAVG